MKNMFQKTVRVLALLCVFAIPTMSQYAEAKKPQISGKININTASPEQLRLLPSVGPKIAIRIVKFRTKRKFKTVADLRKVKGIGAKTFSKMKKYITVTSPTKVRVKANSK